MRILPLLLALALIPSAMAHVNAISVEPTDPLPPLEATPVEITLFANCAVVAGEYDSESRSPLTLHLDENAPASLGVTGDEVPFTMADPSNCNSDPNAGDLCPCVFTTGNIYLTPGAMAPAFEVISVQPDATNANGAEPGDPDGAETVQGGAFNFTVGYYGNLTGDMEHVEIEGEADVELVVTLASNGATTLLFEVESDGVTVDGLPETLDVESPLLEGNTTSTITVPLRLVVQAADSDAMDGDAMDGDAMDGDAMGNESHDESHGMMVTINVTPVSTDDGSFMGDALETGFHVVPKEHDHSDHEHEDTNDQDSPGLPVVLVGALLALAVVLRRR